MPRYHRGKLLRLWNGKPMPYNMQLNLDFYTMTAKELEGKRIKAKEAARKRAEEKKEFHGEGSTRVM